MTIDAPVLAVKRRRPLYRDLSVQIIVAMVLGIAIGWIWPASADTLKPFGDAFIRLVRMVVAPIIFCTVVHGIASAGQAKSVGRIALRAVLYFFLLTSFALALALVLVNFLHPGAGVNADPASFTNGATADVVRSAARNGGFAQFLLDIVPASAVGAFAEGDVLPVYSYSFFQLRSSRGTSARASSGTTYELANSSLFSFTSSGNSDCGST